MTEPRTMPSTDVALRLSREWNVWLCTLRRDGSPHLTPVWFVYADETWWIGCGWDVSTGSDRVLLEIPVRRWLLAGTAQ
ncbi:pyridoxamine 5'-phosphate oxidase family protein [Micromonospora sp. NPDC049171]|uniref:pyridoxamine 5'-phosphate oxidase family protein n=1 Tax=Micromonospora sp. NPDC049171 TaxID=3155770 RepID=UPI00340FF366